LTLTFVGTKVASMRNITGAPAEGPDYFERPRELQRLQLELENGGNIRLNAPRRVGKTSLVLRLCRAWQDQGHPAVFLNVEDAADELSFVEKLLDGLLAAKLLPDRITRCKLWISNARRALGISKVAVGIDLELGGDDQGRPATLGRAVESVFEEIESAGRPVLIAIDEMPEVLLALSDTTDGRQRVARLLHWLRAVRQTYRRWIRWVFLGSIGLEGFVEERLLGKTINDLTPFSLEALSPDEARELLTRLGRDNSLPLSTALHDRILDRVGWPIPHHLQIVFHALRDLGGGPPDERCVDEAFRNLLGPANLSQFDTWRQRLDEQFSAEDAAAAKAVLHHLCQHPSGRTRTQCLDALMSRHPQRDPPVVEERLARLLQLLQRDGYLIEAQGAYAFRSFLLREYWHRRHVT
jgi:hypothetical protein